MNGILGFWRLLAFTLMLGCLPAWGQSRAAALLRPPAHAARPWRIGYVETKTFANYAATLASLARGLKELGWIATVDGLPYVPDQTDTRGLWDWLSSRDQGANLVFAADGYYSFQGVEGDAIAGAAEPIIQRLRERQDLDLVITMGTDAGKALANGRHRTPVLVFSTSNAVKAGIIKSAEDSARDNVWAHVDPDRYRRQIEIFHDLFKFKTLGIAYEDTRSGRTFAAIDDLEQVAKARGFKVVRELVDQPGKGGMEAFYANLTADHRRLAPRVDAAYLGLFIGIQPERIEMGAGLSPAVASASEDLAVRLYEWLVK